MLDSRMRNKIGKKKISVLFRKKERMKKQGKKRNKEK